MILDGSQIVKETPYHTPFLWVYTGGVVILGEGTYTICDTSNEGSKVWIAGKLEIDNNGLHPSKQVRKILISQLASSIGLCWMFDKIYALHVSFLHCAAGNATQWSRDDDLVYGCNTGVRECRTEAQHLLLRGCRLDK